VGPHLAADEHPSAVNEVALVASGFPLTTAHCWPQNEQPALSLAQWARQKAISLKLAGKLGDASVIRLSSIIVCDCINNQDAANWTCNFVLAFLS